MIVSFFFKRERWLASWPTVVFAGAFRGVGGGDLRLERCRLVAPSEALGDGGA
jgi:hypothetical protein